MPQAAVRRRLVSATYEAGGIDCKATLHDFSLAVYDSTQHPEDVARTVADTIGGDHRESFYMMDASAVERRVDEWKDHLPFVRPFYPIRVNDDPLLIQIIANHFNIQVSSLSELERALEVVPPSRIMFNSHLLTRRTIRALANLPSPLAGVVMEDEDSICDLSLLAPTQPTLLRVSLSPESERVDLSTGVEVGEAVKVISRLYRNNVPLSGISVQLLAGRDDNLLRAQALSRLLQNVNGYGVSVVDVGDGFRSGSLLTVAFILEAVKQTAGQPINLVASPGHFLAASAFSLVTSVIGKRLVPPSLINGTEDESVGYLYQTNESVYGVFSAARFSIDGAKTECVALKEKVEEGVHRSVILGSELDPFDVPQWNARLPSLSIGDWLLWKEMGATGQRDEDGIPVYYFTEKAHMDRVKEGSEERQYSDGGSEAESDDDNDDMSEFFGRVFMNIPF